MMRFDPLQTLGRRMRRLAAAVIVILVIPAPAAALYGDEYGAFGLNGSIRGIGMVLDNDPGEDLGEPGEIRFHQVIGRLTAAGRPADRVKYEAHLVQTYTGWSSEDVSLGAFGGGTITSSFDGGRRYRAVDESWDMQEEADRWAELYVDRFNLRYAFDWGDVTVGRQAVTFGKAWFWNPMDVFLPFDPGQFDRDYKAGVDAIRIDVPLGMFSGLTFIAVGGREIGLDGRYADGGKSAGMDWTGSALLLRGYTHYEGWDVALQGGKVYGGYHVSGGVVGEVAGVQIRAEAAQFFATDSPALPQPLEGDLLENRLTAVVGMGYRFENSLDLEFETLYNGGGEDNSDDYARALLRQAHGIIPHLGRWLAGCKASYDITPLVTGNGLFIQSFSDNSQMVQPYLTVSLSDNADLIAGAAFNIGKQPENKPSGSLMESEFGSYPDQYFIEVKIYF